MVVSNSKSQDSAFDFVIWDFDGTIADTKVAIETAVDATLEIFGYAAAAPGVVSAMIGLSLQTIFAKLASDAERDVIKAMEKQYRVEFAVVGPTSTTVFPEVVDLLKKLTSADTQSAIATSKARGGVTLMLDRLGIARHFVAVLSDDDVKNKKPDPEMVQTLCTKLHVPASRTLVIGDTIFDVQMGNDAGAHTCAVTWGNQTRDRLREASPDFIVEDPRALASVLSVPFTHPRVGGMSAGDLH